MTTCCASNWPPTKDAIRNWRAAYDAQLRGEVLNEDQRDSFDFFLVNNHLSNAQCKEIRDLLLLKKGMKTFVLHEIDVSLEGLCEILSGLDEHPECQSVGLQNPEGWTMEYWHAFASCLKHMPALEGLTLTGMESTAEVLKVLQKPLARVTDLIIGISEGLCGSIIGEMLRDEVVQWEGLFFGGCGLRNRDIEHIADALKTNSRLKTLHINANPECTSLLPFVEAFQINRTLREFSFEHSGYDERTSVFTVENLKDKTKIEVIEPMLDSAVHEVLNRQRAINTEERQRKKVRETVDDDVFNHL